MTSTPTPTKSDVAALWVTLILGVAAAAWTLGHAVRRVAEIIPNRDVPVTASFADTPATLPIGPGGTAVDVVAQEVVIRASGMPPVTLAALVLAEVVYTLAVVATIALVCLIIRNIIRGHAFSRSTVRYVSAATLVVAIGWALTSLFATMGANGAASTLAQGHSVNTLLPIGPVVLFAIASMGALAAAFQIGHKLQREAEGLI